LAWTKTIFFLLLFQEDFRLQAGCQLDVIGSISASAVLVVALVDVIVGYLLRSPQYLEFFFRVSVPMWALSIKFSNEHNKDLPLLAWVLIDVTAEQALEVDDDTSTEHLRKLLDQRSVNRQFTLCFELNSH